MWQLLFLVSIGVFISLMAGAVDVFHSNELLAITVLGASIWFPFCLVQVFLEKNKS